MTVTPELIKARFPEFECIKAVTIQIHIDDAVVLLNPSYWGSKYDLGVSYLAAHSLALSQKTLDGSTDALYPVSAQAVDGVSISHATPTLEGDEAYYGSTLYGQRFLELRRHLGIAAYVI